MVNPAITQDERDARYLSTAGSGHSKPCSEHSRLEIYTYKPLNSAAVNAGCVQATDTSSRGMTFANG